MRQLDVCVVILIVGVFLGEHGCAVKGSISMIICICFSVKPRVILVICKYNSAD
jgi:hypothetical protein